MNAHTPDVPSLPWLENSLRAAFGDIDADFVDLIRRHLEWVSLPGGQALFHQGDPGDTLYFLVGGRLRVTARDELGMMQVLGDIRRGETLGEMALLTGEPRSATVVAVRDSQLVALTRTAYEDILRHHPLASMPVARFIVERMRRGNDPRQARSRPATIALVTITEGVDAGALATELLPPLRRHGETFLADAAAAERALGKGVLAGEEAGNAADAQAVSHWIDRMEAEHDLVVLVADPRAEVWTRHCMRHADTLLFLADPGRVKEPLRLLETDTGAHRSLVLLHDPACTGPRVTRQWLDRIAVDDHFHVRRQHAGDLARLARILTGNAVGLVLGGGGARGFAHLGVLKALEEAGIPIDMVGGASIGAVMAACIAFDRPTDGMMRVARHAFGRNPTSDFNLAPLISLIGGRKLRQVIDEAVHELAGFDAHLEDTWKPLYCIATNYSRASEVVLRRGPLGKSVRASVSIPAALPPVIFDGELYMDGGTFNNFPTDVMARQGAGFIFGCDLMRDNTRKVEMDEVPSGWSLLRDKLRPRHRRRHRLPSLTSIILNISILHSQSRLQASRNLTDVCFTPPVSKIGMLNWKAFDAAVEAGYQHAKETLATLPPEQRERLARLREGAGR